MHWIGVILRVSANECHVLPFSGEVSCSSGLKTSALFLLSERAGESDKKSIHYNLIKY